MREKAGFRGDSSCFEQKERNKGLKKERLTEKEIQRGIKVKIRVVEGQSERGIG